jgi:hypothetical protein
MKALLKMLVHYLEFHEYELPTRGLPVTGLRDYVGNAEKWRDLAQWPTILISSSHHPKILKPYR